MISYRIDVEDAPSHLWHVTLTVPQPAAEQRLSLPVWIPGSYMVREFGRHLSGLSARQGQQEVPLRQLDKTTWVASCQGDAAPLEVSCLVYAFDTSVRTAFLDADRGFFNGTSLCLRVEGREHEPHQISFGTLPAGWEIATAMPAVQAAPPTYAAPDYHELIDHPFELGRFWRGSFEAAGVPHEFVVAGAWPGFDGERLLADARRICEAQIAFWHPDDGPAPFERYVFLLNVVEDGYGGLEHRASTALIASRRDLPRRGNPANALTDGYVTLLGLISHEYFHSWNVKRLKPREFERLDYGQENYTELLWFFEGFTSYYDDLLLVRAGLIDEARYLKLVAKNLNGVLATPGRFVQSVAQSSFDAWVKYYRSDENTPNATVSYYAKGSLVALALDLTLRGAGQGSLDAVMRSLWQRSGGGPIGEDDVRQALEQVAGRSVAEELDAWVHGTEDLDLRPLLARMGVAWKAEPLPFAAALGLRLSEGPVTGVQVRSVLRGSAAERAGVSAGDELVAVDRWRVRRLDDAQQWLTVGAPFELLLVRGQRVLSCQVEPPAQPASNVVLSVDEGAGEAAQALRRAWLRG
ncbi:M61 family metallopeptidase [Azohydromonas caseinilytica]|uniref:M61 family metallopeptidase n=1 Tax=Azohydromonas caseinilytica TaxID=2728836 RepID=A0A848F4Y0_9BURK|nr:PDZ domain-containing protein [Azohydromonas caseinilytica]NML15107.1 M61 family metallopeptidase [Azohydromonas caseinilytica]